LPQEVSRSSELYAINRNEEGIWHSKHIPVQGAADELDREEGEHREGEEGADEVDATG